MSEAAPARNLVAARAWQHAAGESHMRQLAAQAVVQALDDYDSEHGIVRVDTRSQPYDFITHEMPPTCDLAIEAVRYLSGQVLALRALLDGRG